MDIVLKDPGVHTILGLFELCFALCQEFVELARAAYSSAVIIGRQMDTSLMLCDPQKKRRPSLRLSWFLRMDPAKSTRGMCVPGDGQTKARTGLYFWKHHGSRGLQGPVCRTTEAAGLGIEF